MSDFNLSDKIQELPKGLTCACGKCELSKIRTQDVRKFIKLFKDSIFTNMTVHQICRRLDELAGDKLISPQDYSKAKGVPEGVDSPQESTTQTEKDISVPEGVDSPQNDEVTPKDKMREREQSVKTSKSEGVDVCDNCGILESVHYPKTECWNVTIECEKVKPKEVADDGR